MVYGKMEKAIMVVKANVEKIKISNLQLSFESINIDIIILVLRIFFN